MFDHQSGICPICFKRLNKPGNHLGKMTAHVDHDHKTGRVRGLLCWACNKLRVGNNTVFTAKRMLDYLSADFDGREI
jgi:hypothetical protein